jgi:hypothetical protein
MEDRVEARLSSLEGSMLSIHQELRDHTSALKEQTQSLNKVAQSIDQVIRTVLDTKSGITPISLMQISDHQKIVRSLLWAFGLIVVVAIGVNKAGEIVKSAGLKPLVEHIMEDH